MAISIDQPKQRIGPDRLLLPSLGLMGAVFIAAALLLVLNSSALDAFPYLFLLPWIVALAVVIAIPLAALRVKGNFTFYHPLFYAAGSYFFPAFIVGGLALVSGWSQPYFLAFVQDADENLPYTIELIILGYAALALGMSLPLGAKIGKRIGDRLPEREYTLDSLIIPSSVLLFSGIINSLIAFLLGIIGYQKVAEYNSYDGIIFLTTLFWMQASFLLWFIVFKRRRIDLVAVLIVVSLVVTAIAKALVAGNRGSLLQIFVIVGLAFVLSGQKVTFKRGVIGAVFMLVCLVAGMIYGTTFRNVKGSESQASLEGYTDNIFETFEQMDRRDNRSTVEFAVSNLAERLDAVSSVAVVVSNYEQLRPYEEGYGMDNNIWNDTVTFFIPRVIWPDKPVASDPRKYSELYFDFGENSFAITPIGDLLRNFGVVGVGLGMFALGLALRVVYRALVEGRRITTWRATLFFMIITAVSYEGFFGTILPYASKVAVATIVGILLVNIFARRADLPAPR